MKSKYLSVFITFALVFSTITTMGVSVSDDPEPTAVPIDGEPLNITGWPKPFPNYVRSCAIVMDIDEDGRNEIIQSSYGHYTYIWDEDATDLPNWPKSIPADPSCSSSAVGDVDGDGDYEVVTTTWNGGDTYVWHWQNGSLLPGAWPWHFGYAIRANPVIADLDGDGEGEIIVAAMDPDNVYDGVHAFQANGSLYWHTFIENCQGPIAVADVDGDGGVEVVVAAWTATYVLDHDGTVLDSVSGGSHKGVVIGDLDNDETLEIIGSTSNSVRAMQFDGTSLSTFWSTNPGIAFGGYGTTSTGDIDGDGTLEVFYLNGPDGRLYGFDSDGNALSALGFPKDTVSGAPSATDPQSAATIGDVDGDDDREILIGSTAGFIMAWDHDGSVASGFPINTTGQNICSATFADLDLDGDVELCLGINMINEFHVYDLNGTYDPATIEWGSFRHDAQCSGLAWHTPELDHIPLPAFVEVGEEVSITFTAHNPDNMPLHYYVRQMPAGAIFNETSHTFTWTPTAGQLGNAYKIYPFLTDGMRQDHLVWNIEVVDSTKFDIPVVNGWNLISFPIDVNGNAMTVLDDSIRGDGGTLWNIVQLCDSMTGKWKSYSTFKPTALNDLPDVDNTMGLWIHITANSGDANLTIGTGVCPVSTSMQLYAGWNLVGYPSLTPRDIATALAGTGYDMPVEGFDLGAPYRTTQLADTYMMKPDEGYWVHVPADTVWTVDW